MYVVIKNWEYSISLLYVFRNYYIFFSLYRVVLSNRFFDFDIYCCKLKL